ncbi:hypothetical protein H072_4823 [Dactylellina haptotyla CBS 200.50]|uniref:Orn/DAP/Arg decarboxylase 2 N-terminal domain-containing protein n=1 Tax=Dactylellina haptotyla (strain CBS 200.50) TaxID=1284197 RepID=S8AJK8_DACHA|nr:hypothetical protein H072_4823 [Dactylellina haptotyla CBS 200.50]
MRWETQLQKAQDGTMRSSPAEPPSPTDLAIAKHIKSINHSDCELYGEDGFWVFDLDVVRHQLARWKKHLPLVRPFYAVKCNPTPRLLSLLAEPSYNLGFDCATHGEISQILSLSVPPHNIIYANPCKAPSHIRYASKVNVRKMTFDNATELYKIKTYFPDAQCVLRIKVTAEGCSQGSGETEVGKPMYELSKKYGVTLDGAREILTLAKRLGVDVIGLAFHVGSGQRDHRSYVHHMVEARRIWDIAAEVGYDFTLLDIGGGFMDENFEAAAETICKALEMEFGNLLRKERVEVIAEPGRYICSPAFALATSVIAVREEGEESSGKRMVYLADGIYSRINPAMWPGELMTLPVAVRGKRMKLIPRTNRASPPRSSASSDSGIELEEKEQQLEDSEGMEMQGELQEYSLWGPTCDCGDVVLESGWHPKGIEIGDWFVFKRLGAYAINMGNTFNGFGTETKLYCINEEPANK